MADLSPREAQVLLLVSQGFENQEIARRLLLAEDTIKTHCGRLFRKVGARNRAHAVRIGFERGLLTAPGQPRRPPVVDGRGEADFARQLEAALVKLGWTPPGGRR